MRIQYTGERERTIGIQVVYPGEFLEASGNLLAAWRAEHGDVFAVAGAQDDGAGESAGAVIIRDDAAHVFNDVAAADEAAKAVKGRRGK